MTSGSPRGRANASLFKVLFLVTFATLLVIGTERVDAQRADAQRFSVEAASVDGEAFPVQKQHVLDVSHASRKLVLPPTGRRSQFEPIEACRQFHGAHYIGLLFT